MFQSAQIGQFEPIEEERIFGSFQPQEERRRDRKVEPRSEEAEKAVRDIHRATRRQYSAEEKARIVIAG